MRTTPRALLLWSIPWCHGLLEPPKESLRAESRTIAKRSRRRMTTWMRRLCSTVWTPQASHTQEPCGKLLWSKLKRQVGAFFGIFSGAFGPEISLDKKTAWWTSCRQAVKSLGHEKQSTPTKHLQGRTATGDSLRSPFEAGHFVQFLWNFGPQLCYNTLGPPSSGLFPPSMRSEKLLSVRLVDDEKKEGSSSLAWIIEHWSCIEQTFWGTSVFVTQLKCIHHFLFEHATTQAYFRVPGSGRLLFIRQSEHVQEVVTNCDDFWRCNPLDS